MQQGASKMSELKKGTKTRLNLKFSEQKKSHKYSKYLVEIDI